MDYTILDAAKELNSRHGVGTRQLSGYGKLLDTFLPTAISENITDIDVFLKRLAGPDGLSETNLRQIVWPLLSIANGEPYFLSLNPSPEALYFRPSVRTDAQRDIPESYLFSEAMNWGGIVGCGFSFAIAGLAPSEWSTVSAFKGNVLTTSNREVHLSNKVVKLFHDKSLFIEGGPFQKLLAHAGKQPSGTHAGRRMQIEWTKARKAGLLLGANQIRFCSAVAELVEKGSGKMKQVAERLGISELTLRQDLKHWNTPEKPLISQATYSAIFG